MMKNRMKYWILAAGTAAMFGMTLRAAPPAEWVEARKQEAAKTEDKAVSLKDRVESFRRFANNVLRRNDFPLDDIYRLAGELMKQEADMTGLQVSQVLGCVSDAAKKEGRHDVRRAALEQRIRSPRTDADQKVRTTRELIDFFLEQNRPADALAAAEAQKTFPDLKGKTLWDIYGNIGHVHAMTGNLEKALESYREIERKDPSPEAKQRMNILIADEYMNFYQPEKALEVFRKAGDRLREAEYLLKTERLREAKAVAKTIAGDEARPLRERLEACQYFFREPTAEDDAFRRSHPDLMKQVDPSFLRWRVLPGAVAYGRYEFALETADIILASSWGKANYETRVLRLMALCGLGRTAEAGKYAAEEMNSFPNLNEERKFFLQLVADICGTPWADGIVKKAYEKADKAFPGLAPDKKAGLLLSAGRVFALDPAYEAAVFETDRVYNALFVPRPENEYRIPYSPTPILGYADLMAMKNRPAPQPMKWKYGGSMDFLATDVSTGNRGSGIGTKTAEKIRYSEWSAVCDRNGVSFFLRSYDDRAKEIEAGTLGGGVYEIYLAPGENQPYHCYLPEVGNSKCPVWHTTYPNEKTRRLNTAVSDELFHPDGCTVRFFIPWEIYYDLLPDTPEKYWEGDFVHWSRHGGYSWNALVSIHSRSSWGKLRFDIPAEGLREIRIRQIVKAMKKYAEAKDLNNNGALVVWKDPVLGDPEFYEKDLKSLETELDSYVKMVDLKEEMKPETVEFLWNRAVPAWNEIAFRVAEKRRSWLENRFFSSDVKK